SELYTGGELEKMARRALAVEADGASGVYFVPNPIKPGTKKSAGDLDIESRRWLLIDFDPVRYTPGTTYLLDDQKVRSEHYEHQEARYLLDYCKEILEPFGFRGAVIGDSGNGSHLCYPVDLPNDNASRDLHQALLHGLNERRGDAPLTCEKNVKVDV